MSDTKALYLPEHRKHYLKIRSHFLLAILSGDKTFEVRSTADRCFQAGDYLDLQAVDPETLEFILGLHAVVKVLAVYTEIPGLLPQHACMSIALVGEKV